MQARFLTVLAFVALNLMGCKLISFKGAPFQLKTSVEGDIKGYPISCQSEIDFNNGGWGLLCGIGNGMDIKYRTRTISDDQTQLELMITKAKNGQEKIIALPTLIVKKTQTTRNVTTTGNATIAVMAEHIQ